MKRYSRFILLIISIILFAIALVCLFSLDIEGIKYNQDINGTEISFILSGHAILGESSAILNGTYVEGVLHMNSSLFVPVTLSFDFITFILLTAFTISLVFMIIFASRKTLLLIFTLINTLLAISIFFQPLYFLVVNWGNKVVIDNFFPTNETTLIGIGAICFTSIMLINDILYFYRISTLFKHKPIVIY